MGLDLSYPFWTGRGKLQGVSLKVEGWKSILHDIRTKWKWKTSLINSPSSGKVKWTKA